MGWGDDIVGPSTCHTSNGESVIDLALVIEHSQEMVDSFQLEEWRPLLLDHCPVYVWVDIQGIGKLEE